MVFWGGRCRGQKKSEHGFLHMARLSWTVIMSLCADVPLRNCSLTHIMSVIPCTPDAFAGLTSYEMNKSGPSFNVHFVFRDLSVY